MPYPYRYAPNAEIRGAAAIAIFNNFRRDSVIESLEVHGLTDLDPEQWYPVDRFIDVFKQWSGDADFSANLVSIGMAIIYHLELPTEIESLPDEEKLLHLGRLFEAQHRNGNVGQCSSDQIGPQHIRYSESSIWPDDMIYGYIYGSARRYLPRGVHFTVSYDETEPTQNLGGDRTVIHLTWE